MLGAGFGGGVTVVLLRRYARVRRTWFFAVQAAKYERIQGYGLIATRSEKVTLEAMFLRDSDCARRCSLVLSSVSPSLQPHVVLHILDAHG